MGFLNWLTSPLSAAFGWGNDKKKKEDPYAALMSQLNPYLESNRKISEQTTTSGLANTAAARSDYDFVNKYLKDILTGSDDNILKFFDSSMATRNEDENEQMLSELGVRGGRRAAALAQTGFNRDAAISRVLQQLRFSAPMQIAQISQAIGNLGLGELSAAQGSGAQASNILFGVEQLKDADADRRNQLIASIFSAIGATAGTIACVSPDKSYVGVKNGVIRISDLVLGDDVLSYDEDGNLIELPVVRITPITKQVVSLIRSGENLLEGSLTHVFYNDATNFLTTKCKDVVEDSTVFMFGKKAPQKIELLGEPYETDVMLVKIGDEEQCYPIIINNFVCEDADPLEKL